ncbi:MAG TPA: hypothetical protein PL037_02500 [Elusimicrobiales bacterium]|nr:hypothetical protein [Elusimicrobiales bacterium]
MRKLRGTGVFGKKSGKMLRSAAFVLIGLACDGAFLSGAYAAFEDTPLGARPLGLGGAVTALEDANASFLNPALPGSVRKFDGGAHFQSGTRSSMGPLDFYSYALNASVPGMIRGKFGTMSVAGRYRSLEDGGLAEKTVSLGWATWQLARRGAGSLDFGAGLKFMRLDSDDSADSKMGLGLDLGALWRVGSRSSFGLSLLNVNAPSFREGVLNEKAPFAVRVGAAERTEDYTLSIDAVRRSVSGNGGKYGFNCGVEHLWRTERSGRFSSRIGLSLVEKASMFSLGVGHRHLASDISYAVVFPLTGRAKAGHALSLNIRFGDRDLDSEYETLIKREIKYRRDLVQALDESSRREGALRDELGGLKEEVEALSARLKDESERKAEAAEAKERLEAVVARQRRAEAELRTLEENRRKDRLLRLEQEFERDWQAYLKMKAGGAPAAALKGALQRLLGQYQGAGIDISRATLELRRLVSR